MSESDASQDPNSSVYPRGPNKHVYLELQELFDKDVFDIAEWSGERSEVEKIVFAVRAVRHGLNGETAKKFRIPGNLKSFVDLFEEVISRCVEKIPQQATNKDVKRALLAAIEDMGLA